MHLTAVVGQIDLHAALFLAELHHRAHVFVGHEDRHRIDRLADFGDLVGRGHLARILHALDFTVREQHLIDHARSRGDEVHVVLALKALLHDVHVQEAQEARAEPKAQRLRDFGLKAKRRIVELQFHESLAQRVVLVAFNRIEASKDLGLDFLKARQRLGRTVDRGRDGVAHASVFEFLDARNDEAHFARGKGIADLGLGREDAHLFNEVRGARCHEADLVLGTDRAVDDSHERDDAHVIVKPAVDDERLQRCVGVALGRRHVAHDALENVVDAHAGLGGAKHRVGGVDPDHVLDFLLRGDRVGAL